MANAARLNRLADYVEAHVEKDFNMGNLCDCYVGFTSAMEPEVGAYPRSADVADWYDMNDAQRRELFFPNYGVPTDDGGRPGDFIDQITREEAVTVLRHFADTGTVNWKLTHPTIVRW